MVFSIVVIIFVSALEDRQKSDLDLDHDHLAEYDLRSRSDPDLA